MANLPPVTPQLAKLIVLEWQVANLRKIRDGMLTNPEPYKTLTESDLKNLNVACNTQIEQLESNITYQKTVVTVQNCRVVR